MDRCMIEYWTCNYRPGNQTWCIPACATGHTGLPFAATLLTCKLPGLLQCWHSHDRCTSHGVDAPSRARLPGAARTRRPVLSWTSFLPSAQPRMRSVLDLGPAVGLTGARAGIAQALRAQGIGPGHEVLVPAYHCIAMIEPVTFCGATS